MFSSSISTNTWAFQTCDDNGLSAFFFCAGDEKTEKGENRPLVKSKLERKRTGEEGDSWGRVSVLSSIRRYGKTYVMDSYFLRMMM